MLSGGIWGNTTGTVRVGRKIWEKTLVQILEKSPVPETEADISFLCPLHAFPLLISLLVRKHELWAQPLPPFKSTSLVLPCFSSHCIPRSRMLPKTVPGCLSCKSLASQPQPSHHMLSCSTQAALYCQYKPSFAVGWMMGIPFHHLSLATPTTQADGLSSSHPFSPSH